MCKDFNICRLCAMKENTRNFTDINSHHNFPEMLQVLLDIQIIKEEQGTPICMKCYRSTNEFYSFFCLVHEGQKKLEQLKNNATQVLLEDFPLEPFINLKVEDTNCDDNLSESKESLTKDDSYGEESSCDENSESIEDIDSKSDVDFDVDGSPTYPKLYNDGKLILSTVKLNNVLKTFFSLKCEICSLSFSVTYELFGHYKSEHGVKGYITCCGARMHNRKTVINHLGQHIQPSAFECPICKKFVSRASNLREHLKNHLPDEDKPFKCDECIKSYSQKHHLITHKMTHIPYENREKLSCEFCGKVFTLPNLLKTHISMMHRHKTYLCSECGKSFKALQALKNHTLCHDKEGINQVKCEICGIICKNYLTLRQHIKKHSNIHITCNLCDFKTHKKGYLKRHMDTKHSNIMPFACSICKKLFKLKKCLESHMSMHTGEKKYICPHCPKTFANSGNFSKHKKRMHPVETRILEKAEQSDKTH